MNKRIIKKNPVDVEVIRILYRAGQQFTAIGKILNVSPSVVRSRVLEHGMTRGNEPPAAPAKPAAILDRNGNPVDPDLIETGGRYTLLMEYAAAKGISLSHARMRWHQSGLPTTATPGTTMHDRTAVVVEE